MKKRITSIGLVVLILFISGVGLAEIMIGMEDGFIYINRETDGPGRVAIVRDGVEAWHTVARDTERLPIQLGAGEYYIYFFDHKYEDKYLATKRKSFNIEEGQCNDFLGSTSPIYWDYEMKVIKKAQILTEEAQSQKEKIKIIYDYVTKNIYYDWDMYENMPKFYVPNIETINKTQKGVCYDYSAIFAGMLRSVGIKTKLVKGYREDGDYHAWNEVLINGKWETIDTTYSSSYIQAGQKVEMYQNPLLYKKESTEF